MFATPDERCDHVDLVGLLLPSHGSVCLLTCILIASHGSQEHIPDITADTVAKGFVRIWFSCFGALSIVTTYLGILVSQMLTQTPKECLSTTGTLD